MRQTTIDLIQSFAILCIAFACICNSLCIFNPNNYEDSRLVRFVLRIKAHFQRSSSTGFGQSSETGKQANHPTKEARFLTTKGEKHANKN